MHNNIADYHLKYQLTARQGESKIKANDYLHTAAALVSISFTNFSIVINGTLKMTFEVMIRNSMNRIT